MKAISTTEEKNMGRENMQWEEFWSMKVIFKMINSMGKDISGIWIKIQNIRDNLEMVWNMAKELLLRPMEEPMKVTSKTTINMGGESTPSGKKNTKDNSKMDILKVKVPSNTVMEMSIPANFPKEKDTVREDSSWSD